MPRFNKRCWCIIFSMGFVQIVKSSVHQHPANGINCWRHLQRGSFGSKAQGAVDMDRIQHVMNERGRLTSDEFKSAPQMVAAMPQHTGINGSKSYESQLQVENEMLQRTDTEYAQTADAKSPVLSSTSSDNLGEECTTISSALFEVSDSISEGTGVSAIVFEKENAGAASSVSEMFNTESVAGNQLIAAQALNQTFDTLEQPAGEPMEAETAAQENAGEAYNQSRSWWKHLRSSCLRREDSISNAEVEKVMLMNPEQAAEARASRRQCMIQVFERECQFRANQADPLLRRHSQSIEPFPPDDAALPHARRGSDPTRHLPDIPLPSPAPALTQELLVPASVFAEDPPAPPNFPLQEPAKRLQIQESVQSLEEEVAAATNEWTAEWDWVESERRRNAQRAARRVGRSSSASQDNADTGQHPRSVLSQDNATGPRNREGVGGSVGRDGSYGN